MSRVLDPFRFVLISLAGWMNQRQLHVIDYLREENRVLREQLGDRRLRLNDDQRRRLAAKAKRLKGTILEEIATIVTPDTPDGLAPTANRAKVRRKRQTTTRAPTQGRRSRDLGLENGG